MKLYDAEEAINAVLKASLEAYTPLSGWAAPVAYWPSVVPQDGTPNQRDGSGNAGQWVEFGILPNEGGIACVGGTPAANKYRRAGVYVARVHVLADAPNATGASARLCEAVIDGFDQADGAVWFRRNRFVQGVAEGRVGPWFLRSVTGEFQFDDHK